MVFLENVAKRETATIVTAELQGLQYCAAAFFACSASFGVPQSRARLYILAIDTLQCEIHDGDGPDMWAQWMEDTRDMWFQFEFGNKRSLLK